MAKISKATLFLTIENALRQGGWNTLRLSKANDHPALYQIYFRDKNYRMRLYIWNLSHGGGKKRPDDEYRIQITGIKDAAGKQQFQKTPDVKTVILGWWDQVGVFAGFDYAHHKAPLGTSPSIQVGEAALHAAHANGLAPHNKGNGELAIAFRPDFFGSYVENLESLHACGAAPAEINLLTAIATNPVAVNDAAITTTVDAPRRTAVVMTKRALRDINFRNRVLTAYGHRCAMCGTQLRLLDAAHIVPVAYMTSTDDTSNGVALCALHHRAYDLAFVTFDEKCRTRHNRKAAAALKVDGHDGGLADFLKRLRPVLALPPDPKDRPSPEFIKTANDLRGW